MLAILFFLFYAIPMFHLWGVAAKLDDESRKQLCIKMSFVPVINLQLFLEYWWTVAAVYISKMKGE